ncbi:MAG: LysE family transporter [Verrucomicrobiales bacterium]|nr:LysE family transporter [Verrucomicrobiales bacterium]MCP5526447.1 LysE family transporter [Verrucomicrobiales bacterium]
MMDPLLLWLSFLVGLLSGLMAAVPVGPINTAILNEGGHRGFGWAFRIGLGATVMEGIYCGLGFASFSGLFTNRWWEASLQMISFLLMLFIGLRYLRLEHLPSASRTERVVEAKLHPHTAFMTGFLRVLGNPGVLVFWVMASSLFLSHGWIDSSRLGKAVCVAGVTSGILLWFTVLSYAATHAHRRLSERRLVGLARVSGALLLGLALVIMIRLIALLAKRG